MTRLALALLLTTAAASAQSPALDAPDRPLVVMNLAAHPDDEDGLTMAYYRGNQDAVVYSVITTRGEGGQNEAGPDLYERLGAIRTTETEAAARILGTRVLYLNRYDFGFSKHAAEAFAEWSQPRTGFWEDRDTDLEAAAGRDALVADVVHLIRRFKPDVLFTNHDTTTAWPDAQHGHHQATGIAAYDAFHLAADPSYRPDDLEADGVDLWQPSRLFVRARGWSDDGEPYEVAVPVGDICAATTSRPEETCADRAVTAVSEHISQGFDVFAPRFRRDTTYFRLMASADGVATLEGGATDLAEGLAPNTAYALDLATLVDSGRLPTVGLEVNSPTVVPTNSVYLTWSGSSAFNPGDSLTVMPPPGAPTMGLFAAKPQTTALEAGRLRVPIPSGTTPSAPRYRAQYSQQGGTEPLLYVVTRDGEPIAGGRLPVEVVPPATVDLDAAPMRLVPGVNRIPVEVTVFEAGRDSVNVGVTVYRDDRAVAYRVKSVPAGTATFEIDLEDAEPGEYRVQASARTTGCGLPWFIVQRPAAILPDVAVAPGLRVGFVESYDGTTADALRVMGADVVELDSTALASGDLSTLQTIVVDIRALLVRPDLEAARDRLLEWTENGGHLVVAYHKSFEWNEDGGIAPYPLRLSRDRVTDETAPVTVLEGESPLFNAPHVLEAADWDGWVQERGLYFPGEIDDRYQRLLEVGDPGESPLTTGLLFAEVGAGTYVYTPLGWYRQLAALTPGAWRTFANLVSLPLTDGRAAVGSR